MDNGELTAHLVLPRGHVLGQQGHITQSRRAHENCEGEEKWGRSPDPPARGEVCWAVPRWDLGPRFPPAAAHVPLLSCLQAEVGALVLLGLGAAALCSMRWVAAWLCCPGVGSSGSLDPSQRLLHSGCWHLAFSADFIDT